LESNKIAISGFEAGEYVEVVCEGDKITFTKTPPPTAPASKKSLEEKISELDSKKRKKLAELIDKL